MSSTTTVTEAVKQEQFLNAVGPDSIAQIAPPAAASSIDLPKFPQVPTACPPRPAILALMLPPLQPLLRQLALLLPLAVPSTWHGS